MTLSESYHQIKKSIVAFCAKYTPINDPKEVPPFPRIIGTGFIAREDGIIVTNEHVVRAFGREYRPPGTPETDPGVVALLLHMTDAGQVVIPLEVMGVGGIAEFKHGPAYYGPKRPDVAFVHVKAKSLPTVKIAASRLILEGIELATAGYPMGSDALIAPGYLHQITPTLQRGIVSAVLPYACDNPHAFTINVMALGGASGSPVFDPETGEVMGVLYAGLKDLGVTKNKDIYSLPTNITYVVPASFVHSLLQSIQNAPEVTRPADAQTIEEMLDGKQLHNILEEDQKYEIIELKLKSQVSETLKPIEVRHRK